jgi:hypothetical protein
MRPAGLVLCSPDLQQQLTLLNYVPVLCFTALRACLVECYEKFAKLRTDRYGNHILLRRGERQEDLYENVTRNFESSPTELSYTGTGPT